MTSLVIHIREPVGGEVDADLAVVDVGVLGATFFGGENLDGLVGRADRVIELLRVLDRHDPVVAGVGDEEGQVMFFATSFSENFFAISMPSSSSLAPMIQRHWKFDCATDFGASRWRP